MSSVPKENMWPRYFSRVFEQLGNIAALFQADEKFALAQKALFHDVKASALIGYGELLAAFLATALEYNATVLGCHTRTEAMGTVSL